MTSRYRNKRTERFASREFVPAFSSFAKQAAIKLRIVESARDLSTLRVLPGNRFESLRGDRVGQYSIRINNQWRICFEWSEELSMAINIEIVDYPWENPLCHMYMTPSILETSLQSKLKPLRSAPQPRQGRLAFLIVGSLKFCVAGEA
ncbi:MAG: type II toxin-antitoxin system RelE/ParE family toxin [Thermomicrobiales bacterium]